jgi:hypothetical protein
MVLPKRILTSQVSVEADPEDAPLMGVWRSDTEDTYVVGDNHDEDTETSPANTVVPLDWKPSAKDLGDSTTVEPAHRDLLDALAPITDAQDAVFTDGFSRAPTFAGTTAPSILNKTDPQPDLGDRWDRYTAPMDLNIQIISTPQEEEKTNRCRLRICTSQPSVVDTDGGILVDDDQGLARIEGEFAQLTKSYLLTLHHPLTLSDGSIVNEAIVHRPKRRGKVRMILHAKSASNNTDLQDADGTAKSVDSGDIKRIERFVDFRSTLKDAVHSAAENQVVQFDIPISLRDAGERLHPPDNSESKLFDRYDGRATVKLDKYLLIPDHPIHTADGVVGDMTVEPVDRLAMRSNMENWSQSGEYTVSYLLGPPTEDPSRDIVREPGYKARKKMKKSKRSEETSSVGVCSHGPDHCHLQTEGPVENHEGETTSQSKSHSADLGHHSHNHEDHDPYDHDHNHDHDHGHEHQTSEHTHYHGSGRSWWLSWLPERSAYTPLAAQSDDIELANVRQV